MQHLDVHSYGKCLHNIVSCTPHITHHTSPTLCMQDLPSYTEGWPWWEVKWNITSQYKFIIALENSVSEDYVSEKLFHAFIVGTVPGVCVCALRGKAVVGAE